MNECTLFSDDIGNELLECSGGNVGDSVVSHEHEFSTFLMIRNFIVACIPGSNIITQLSVRNALTVLFILSVLQ
jgi:hypothetical protein